MHITYLYTEDSRRHKVRCIYYSPLGKCILKKEDCYGSAHCDKYSEDIEQLLPTYFQEYKQKKKLIIIREQQFWSHDKVVLMTYLILKKLPLQQGMQIGARKLYKQLCDLGYEELVKHLSPAILEAACKLFNKQDSLQKNFMIYYKFSEGLPQISCGKVRDDLIEKY